MHLDRPKILIVDDDDGARTVLAGWLTKAGYDCRTASKSGEALAQVQAHPPDAIVVDVGLRDRDGLWLAEALRQQHSDVGVILLSTSRSLERDVTAMRIGAFDCLQKPFRRSEVLASIDRALHWRAGGARSCATVSPARSELAARQAALMQVFAQASPRSTAAVMDLIDRLHAPTQDFSDHGRRVAEWAVALAWTLHVPATEIDHIERAALLHGIGELVLPKYLLRKQGAFSLREIEIVREHSTLGAEVMSVVPFLTPAARLVASVHERWDGAGYPLGIEGTDIPIGARVVAVADAFDAMTERRIYREPISTDEANAELVRCAGTQFDPDVVRAWLRAQDTRACC